VDAVPPLLLPEALPADGSEVAVGVLFTVAAGLLLVVTGGIAYLAFVEWQDKEAEKAEREKQAKKVVQAQRAAEKERASASAGSALTPCRSQRRGWETRRY